MLSKGFIYYLLILILTTQLLSCASWNSLTETEQDDAVRELAIAISSTSSHIDIEEANRISETLIASTEDLAMKYKMVSPPRYHNLLVHLGLKKYGLCCHWVKDLHTNVKMVDQQTLRFNWLVANLGRHLSEHNSLVISSYTSSWKQGIIFDPWRKSGDPFWQKVDQDAYSWQLHPLDGQWDKLRCL